MAQQTPQIHFPLRGGQVAIRITLRAMNSFMVEFLLTFGIASHEDADKSRSVATFNNLSGHYRAPPFAVPFPRAFC
jgi:hypothetical protein